MKELSTDYVKETYDFYSKHESSKKLNPEMLDASDIGYEGFYGNATQGNSEIPSPNCTRMDRSEAGMTVGSRIIQFLFTFNSRFSKV